MTLPHLLIGIVSSMPGLLLLGWLLRLGGFDILHNKALFLLVDVVSLFAGLPLAWWICKRLRLAPMGLFAPVCPHCGKQPGGWNLIEPHWPVRVVLACGLCGGRVELWLERPRTSHAISSALPSYRLRAPKFCGSWQRLNAGEGDQGTPGALGRS